MSAILLRTMARKSIIGGGKYQGRTVQEILGYYPTNLIVQYFDYSMISFTNDVLDELGITEEYRIPKPGKSSEMRHKFFLDRLNEKLKDLHGIDRVKDYSHQQKVNKGYKKRIFKSNERFHSPLLSKSRLKATNQGGFRK